MDYVIKIIKLLLTIVCLTFIATTSRAVQHDTQGIDFPTALRYAELANAVYQSEAEVRLFSEAKNMTLNVYATLTDLQITFLLVTDSHSREQKIVVRGTSNIENAMIDVSKNGSKGQENSRGIECIH